jgi:hypothetical protein
MRALQPLAVAEFDSAPFRFTASGHVAGSARAVFTELADPARFFPMMTRSVWTTAETGGVGAEREVTLRILGRFHERMLVWEPDRRLTFAMTGTTSPLVDQLGEDFRISPEDGGVRLDWIVAGKPSGLGRVATPALRLMLRRLFGVYRRRLEKLVATSHLGVDQHGRYVS